MAHWYVGWIMCVTGFCVFALGMLWRLRRQVRNDVGSQLVEPSVPQNPTHWDVNRLFAREEWQGMDVAQARLDLAAMYCRLGQRDQASRVLASLDVHAHPEIQQQVNQLQAQWGITPP